MNTDSEDRFRRGLEAFVGVNFTDGNSVTRLRNGVQIFPAILREIHLAESRIDFVTFVYWTGDIARQMAAALSERALAGVKVRVLLDAVGANEMADDLVRQMVEAGVEIAWFRPVTRWKVWEIDHRTHRKILVIDDRVAFTGGVGVAKEWEGDARDPTEWRDTHYEIRGPAIDGLRAAFLGDWRDADRMLVDLEIPARPEPAGDTALGIIDGSAQIELNMAGRAFETVVTLAEKRLWITTPYFNPSSRLTRLLIQAARRDVDVQIMIPGPYIDKRLSLVAAEEQAVEMLEAGVWLHRFQPTMLHAKQMVADDSVAMFGSVNFNERSFYKDEEVAVVAIDGRLTELLASDFLDDLERCTTIANHSELQRSPKDKAVSKLLRPFHSEM